jgi:hypothetical protein
MDLMVPCLTGFDCLRPKPSVQFREIKVPALPISANRMSRERAFAGLTEHGFGMHHKEAGSVFGVYLPPTPALYSYSTRDGYSRKRRKCGFESSQLSRGSAITSFSL